MRVGRELCVLIFAGATICAAARAQDAPPQGIGVWQLGARVYGPQTHYYDSNGDRVSQGSRFESAFTGERMLEGKTGPSLRDLAGELRKFAGQNPGEASIVNDLHLGTLKADIDARVKAWIFGLGYGLRDDVTLFAGVPVVDASVRTSLRFTGPNNALEIKQRLGSLAFDELAAGLDEASTVNADRIRKSITDAGYQDIDVWEKRALGDARMGANAVVSKRALGVANYRLLGTFVVEAPTGYREKPDILTDINFGKGAWTPTISMDHRLTFPSALRSDNLFVSGVMSISQGIPTHETQRVPVAGEAIIDKDRTTTVRRSPGFEPALGGGVGGTWRSVTAQYGVSWMRHFMDRYDGDLKGDYASMGADSDSLEVAHEMQISYSTVSMYRQKTFAVPMIVGLAMRAPIQARNSSDNRWVVLSLTSFFSTPAAKSTDQRPQPKAAAALGRPNP